jgi:hypothetical protein
LISNKALGRLLVEPKTLGWGTLKEKFRKCFRKPWCSIYSIEMFSKMVLDQKELGMEEKGVVVFKGKDIGDYVLTWGN